MAESTSTTEKPRRGRPRKVLFTINQEDGDSSPMPIQHQTSSNSNRDVSAIIRIPIFDDDSSDNGSGTDTDIDDNNNIQHLMSQPQSSLSVLPTVGDLTTTDKNSTFTKPRNKMKKEELLEELYAQDRLIMSLGEKHKRETAYKRYYLKYKPDIKILDNEQQQSLATCLVTDLACWHCTYGFDTPPCFIADKCINGVYHVFGCFCSFNCALTYNQGMGDFRIADRKSVTIRLYCEIFQTDEPPHMAPRKEILEKFTRGGITIAQFRSIAVMRTTEYTMTLPPMVHSFGELVEQTKAAI